MSVELRAEIFPSLAHELACQLVVYAMPEKFKGSEAGAAWRHRVEAHLPEPRRRALGEELREFGALVTALTDLSFVRRWSSVEDMLRGLEAEPRDELVLQLAGLEAVPGLRERMAELVLRAAAGDSGAAAELAARGPALGHGWAPALARMLPRVGPDLPEWVSGVVRSWHDAVRADEERTAAVLERDAAAKRELGLSLSAEALLEEATNGTAWSAQPGVDAIGLLPTCVMRPWTYWGRWGSCIIFSYPVADESLGGNGDALAARAARLARVLGDESRLRALQLLAQEPLTLQEMADALGLRKSTMHHHLAQMRAAGLLRSRLGSKKYSLRRQPLERFGALLGELAAPASGPVRSRP